MTNQETELLLEAREALLTTTSNMDPDCCLCGGQTYDGGHRGKCLIERLAVAATTTPTPDEIKRLIEIALGELHCRVNGATEYGEKRDFIQSLKEKMK